MPAQKRKSHKVRNAVIAVIAVLVIIGGIGGFIGYTAYGEAKELQKQANTILDDVDVIQDSLASMDVDALTNAALDVRSTSASMQKTLDGPIWGIMEMVPVYGDDVKGVKKVVDTLVMLSDDALVPLTTTLQANPMSALVSDGKINTQSMQTLLGAIQESAPAMQKAADNISSLPDFKLEKLQKTIGKVKTKFEDINETYQGVSYLAPIAGNLLGANGDRQYLIVAQNSAELKPLGGFPGSMGLLTISDGKISMNDFDTPYNSMVSSVPERVGVTNEEVEIFSDRVNRSRDAGLIPDFERVAQIWAAAYGDQNNVSVDGVIAVTPSVVQHLLKVAGEIKLSDGTVLNGKNATKVLEHDLYWNYLNDGTKDAVVDGLFAEAADKTFHKMFEDISIDRIKKLAGVALDDVKTREIMVVMTDPDENAHMRQLGASGKINVNPADPQLGVFTDYWIGCKLGWWYDEETTVGEGVKNADGTTTYPVTTHLYNAMTTAEANTGTKLIVGVTNNMTRGDMNPIIFLVAPAGGTITDVHDDADMRQRDYDYNGNHIVRLDGATLNPQKSIDITYNVVVSADAAEPLDVITTPNLSKYRNESE